MSDVMTYDEMIELLSRGTGIDLDTFDKVGNKTLADLYEEVAERDVVLVYSESTGRVYRVAQSVKVLITWHELYLLEWCRAFKNGVVKEKLRPWSMSETRKRGESALAAAARGLWEEYGLRVEPTPTQLVSFWSGADHTDEHESSVYPGIISFVSSQYFAHGIAMNRWPGGKETVDKHVTIHHAWRRDWPFPSLGIHL